MGDTGRLTLVPEHVEPPAWHLPKPVASSVRWICFLILVASTLLALPARFPPKTDFARLLYDIQQGNTSVVNIENLTPGQATGGRARVLWRTGPFSWHEADVPYRVGMPAHSTMEWVGMVFEGDGVRVLVQHGTWNTAFDEAWYLTADAATDLGTQTHRSIDRRTISTHSTPGSRLNFSFTDPALREPLAVIAGALWLATFLGMLLTRDHPYANRWAWFWLFVIGGVGPMLILWKEPTPLRLRFWRRDPEPYRWTQTPMTGGIGLLTAIGWTIGLTAAASAFGWAASRL